MPDPLQQRLTGPTGGERTALTTVIATRGSTYRRPGARILMYENGRFDGAISGGCVEGEVIGVAREVWQDGAARICLYDTTSDSDLVWGFGIGCKGVVEVLVEEFPSAGSPTHALFAAALRQQQAGVPTVLATRLDAPPGQPTAMHRTLLEVTDQARVLQGDLGHPGLARQVAHDARLLVAQQQAGTLIYTLDVASLPDGQLCGRPAAPGVLPGPGEARVYLEPFLPPPRLQLFGAGTDAVPVAALAQQMGWSVTVIDPRQAFLVPERFPGARLVQAAGEESVALAGVHAGDFCVIMTHSYHRDQAILKDLCQVCPRYIGQMGPRDRTSSLLDDLRKEGVTPPEAFLGALSAPIGLDIGGEGPDQIALAIISELQAVLAGRSGGRLKEQEAALHGPSLGDLGHRDH